MSSRREFLSAPALLAARAKRPPNVVLIITDDQGYGDISLHGNPVLRTPSIDSIGREGVRFTRFRVSPVCAPTRASLMTGRWNYRTGVTDTYLGRAMMRPDEVTLPECLRTAGFRTGIFGKWHLGDNAPLRATDQGFEEALTLRGGGLAQPSSPPGTGYFDPPLEHNNRPITGKGYCTDIFYDKAMEFVEQNRAHPFFCYLALNAPHTPLQIGDEWVAPYRGKGLSEVTEKVYGMVSNIDSNTGRLLGHLKRLGIDRDTMLIFMTDNGPQQQRYNAGMRGLKTTVYEGGIRVPCFIRQPGALAPREVRQQAAHVDLMPTILEACGAALPKDRTIDGRSLLGWLNGPVAKPDERTHFFQWHRGDEPEAWKNCAVVQGDWKLVNGTELYDLRNDPAESRNLRPNEPSIAASLRKEYEKWFEEVGRAGYAPPRIWVGSDIENPVVLTRQDWRGPKASWDAAGLGHYEVEVKRPGRYRVTLRFPHLMENATAVFENGVTQLRATLNAGVTECSWESEVAGTGPARFEGRLEASGKTWGCHYIEVRRLE
ncbi:MAG TPA: arylsulfatase [Bryobacteraceae bacterium]|mgnify:CR=1 FL=1|nr:arylsulfatase [Bryobacteraceae bacterium]HPT27063.1 arylsulfatase [Bryobacteraceae bacterium]